MYRVNQLIGFGAGIQGLPDGRYIGDDSYDDAPGNPKTFSSLGYGESQQANSFVVAMIGWESTGTDVLTGITIGGETATIVVQGGDTNNSNNSRAAIAICDTCTGDTGDVVLTWDSTPNDVAISLVTVVGWSTSVLDTGTDGDDDPAVTLSAKTDSMSFFATLQNTTFTSWSNATNIATIVTAQNYFNSAYRDNTSDGDVTTTATGTGGNTGLAGSCFSKIKLAILTPTDATYNSSNLSTYTFSSRDIGTPSSDRLVVVGVTLPSGVAVTSATIAGETASILVQTAHTSGDKAAVAIISALVTSGTTGNIVINTSGTCLECGIQIYTLKGYSSSTPTNTYTDTSSGAAASVSANIPANGAAIGVVNNDIDTTSITWTNLTEDVDVDTSSTRSSIASDDVMAENSSLTITAAGATSNSVLAVAVWQ